MNRIAALLLMLAAPAAVSLHLLFSSRSEPPIDAVHTSAGWADESRCVECHEDEARSFNETGHARTLIRADSDESLRHLLKLNDSQVARDADIHVRQAGPLLEAVHQVGDAERRLPLEWCFGSGEHARTWVGTLADSRGRLDLVEFRWTWYRDISGHAVTPGQSETPAPGYFAQLGTLYDHPKAVRCFACHASVLPLDNGHIRTESLKPGVTCQRCHGPRQQHVESEGAIHDFVWSEASQTEAVNRCAQCHRRADEQSPEDIRPENPRIVRFAPVGLVQSVCFQQSPEMTCTTCHDPHRPLSQQDSLGIWQCTQCHSSEAGPHSECAAGRRDDCLRCHMPKVREDVPLYFTDHWIRIREPEQDAAQ